MCGCERVGRWEQLGMLGIVEVGNDTHEWNFTNGVTVREEAKQVKCNTLPRMLVW